MKVQNPEKISALQQKSSFMGSRKKKRIHKESDSAQEKEPGIVNKWGGSWERTGPRTLRKRGLATQIEKGE